MCSFHSPVAMKNLRQNEQKMSRTLFKRYVINFEMYVKSAAVTITQV